MNIREQIKDLRINKPFNYTKMIKNNPELYNWVVEHSTADSDKFGDHIHSAITGQTNICKYGNKRTYDNTKQEYKNCGKAGKCKCTAELISNSSKNYRNNTPILDNHTNYFDMDYQTVITKIKEILDDHSSKSFHSLLLKYKNLVEWIEKTTEQYSPKSINERLYILLISPPDKTKCGKYPAFNTYEKGYHMFCGPRAQCKCSREYHSKSLTNFYDNLTPEDNQRRQQDRVNGMLKKHGATNAMHVPEFREKLENTIMERYGVKNALSSHEILSKIKQTNQERYGVDYPLQSNEIWRKASVSAQEIYGNDVCKPARDAFAKKHDGKNPFVVYSEKVKQSLNDKYGVDHPKKSAEICERSNSTLYTNYGVRNPAQIHLNKEVYDILEDKDKFSKLCETYSLKGLAEHLGVNESLIWSRHDRYGLEYYNRRSRSQYEEDIAFWLDSQNITYQRNVKFEGKTLDFLIGDLAIEFNGLYVHSEYSFFGKRLGIDRYYHYNKFINCKNKGITLLTIFEDEWNKNSEMIKNKILIKLNKGQRGAGARKTEVRSIDHIIGNQFLEKYHLQGMLTGALFFGAFNKDELIGVMTFNKRKDNQWELTRFCTDSYIHNGLFSKMLKYFVKSYSPETLYSFSDNRWGWGGVYENNGFAVDYEIPPDYSVTNYLIREHKFNWRKDRIKDRFGVSIENKTELELTLDLKWNRIWDCGKVKWKYSQ